MDRSDINSPQYSELCRRIFGILATKGPSQTTMDLLAKELTISKRTLYEIFGSKDDMLKTILEGVHERYAKDIAKLVKSSANVMEALANILLYHQQAMSQLSANFFRDMDFRYKHLRPDYDKNSRKWSEYLVQALKLGIRQGVVRNDINCEITVSLLRVQMESLKRMEEFFPPGITPYEACNSIALGLLRSIATARGMETLDKLSSRFHSNREHNEHNAPTI